MPDKERKALLLTSALLLSPLVCGCDRSSTAEPTLTPVRTAEVQIITSGTPSTYSANVEPYAQVQLAFKSNGYIKSIRQVKGPDGKIHNIDIGDWVTKGTVLATVDESDYQERLAQSQAQLSRAQSDLTRAKLSFDRTSTLFSAGAATKPDFDNVNAQVQSSQAAVDSANSSISEAKIALGYCELRAPFDSWILQRNVEVGSLVGPATNGFVLADTRSVKAVFGVPDTAIRLIRLGAPQTIRTDAVPGAMVGHVTAIAPSADAKSRVYSVEVTIPNPGNRLKAGMIASTQVNPGPPAQQVMAVPLSAIVRSPTDPSGFAVFLVEGSGQTARAQSQNVSIGDSYGTQVAITSGLRPGQRIVASGATMIKDGDQVRIIR